MFLAQWCNQLGVGAIVGSRAKVGSVRHRIKHVRAKLRRAALTRTPLWFSRGKLATPHDSPIHIERRDVYLPKLPAELDGLRITQLSDFHVGDLITPAHLARIVARTRELASDLIALTGDFVDLTHESLDQVVHELRQLQAPLGIYLVPGNHDYLHDGDTLIRQFRQGGLDLLVNESRFVTHRGRRIAIAGIDYAHHAHTLAQLVRQTFHHAAHHQPHADLRVLLTHHPDAFDAAHHHHIDLTLAGHTHGGQVVLRPRQADKSALGLGSLAFRYSHGLYRRGQHVLYVTSGVGSWFPFRYQCPAEIACLTLRCGNDPSLGPTHP